MGLPELNGAGKGDGEGKLMRNWADRREWCDAAWLIRFPRLDAEWISSAIN